MFDAFDARHHVRPRSAPARRHDGKSARRPVYELGRTSSRSTLPEDVAIGGSARRPAYSTKDQNVANLSIIEGLEERWGRVRDAVEKLRGDRESTRDAMLYVHRCLEHARGALNEDREFMLESVKRGKEALLYAAKSLQGERDLKFEQAMIGWSRFTKLNSQLRQDHEKLIDAVIFHRDALRKGAARLLQERQFELQALSAYRHEKDDVLVEEARVAILRDQELVTSALKRDGHACDFIERRMHADRDFAIQSVEECRKSLTWAQDEIHADYTLVNESLQRFASGSTPVWAMDLSNKESAFQLPTELKELRDFWKKIIANMDSICSAAKPFCENLAWDWEAMLATEKELTEEMDYVGLVLRICGMALPWAPLRMQLDPEMAFLAVRQDYRVLPDVHENVKIQSWEVVLEAVKHDGRYFQYAAPWQRQDYRCVLQAVREDGRAFRYAAPTLRDYKDIALWAVDEYPEALQWCSEGLRADPEVIKQAVSRNGEAFKYADAGMRSDKKFIYEILEIYGLALQFVTEKSKLNHDKRLVTEALKRDWRTVHYIGKELYDDIEVMATACKSNPACINFASKSLRRNKNFYRKAGLSI